MPPIVPENSPPYVKEVAAPIMMNKGDSIPVSKMPCDGTFPTATTQYEKRNIAVDIPEWDEASCIQCALCSYMCPHAAIRLKVYDPALIEGAPSGCFNLGTGRGYSNREVIDAVERVTGNDVPVERCGRRPGDPAELVADASRFETHYGWRAEHSGLDEIVVGRPRRSTYRQRALELFAGGLPLAELPMHEAEIAMRQSSIGMPRW